MRKRTLWGLGLAAVCLVVWLVVMLLHGRINNRLVSQAAAARWSAGALAYTQVSAFISEDAALSADDVMNARQNVEEALSTASMETDDSVSARLWLDAYSAETSMTVSTNYNEQNVRVIATGGDFFFFHPADMICGWYYTNNDSSDSFVVLDELLAWSLFGGTDIAGMEVKIGDTLCVVAGVASTPEDQYESEAYGTEYTIYMSYSLLERMGYGVPITCYEAVVPEPITGFAMETMESALSLEDDDCQMQQNTGRFSLKSSLQVAGSLAERSQRLGRIYFPWWENAARALETRAALLAIIIVILPVYPLIFTLIRLHTFWKNKRQRGSHLTLPLRVHHDAIAAHRRWL